jgi:hypothetical protein|nr:MAG TPA: hypothetical protein [Caudoviricetes sp.]
MNDLIAILNSNIACSLLTGTITLAAVFLERSVNDRKSREREIDITKKMFIDMINQTHSMLSKMETLVEESKSLSYRQLNSLRDVVYSYKGEKIRVYSINDDDVRLSINNLFNDMEYNLLDSYQDLLNRASINSSPQIDEILLQNIKSKKRECESVKSKIESTK